MSGRESTRHVFARERGSCACVCLLFSCAIAQRSIFPTLCSSRSTSETTKLRRWEVTRSTGSNSRPPDRTPRCLSISRTTTSPRLTPRPFKTSRHGQPTLVARLLCEFQPSHSAALRHTSMWVGLDWCRRWHVGMFTCACECVHAMPVGHWWLATISQNRQSLRTLICLIAPV